MMGGAAEGLRECPACGQSFAYLCTMAKEMHMEDLCPARAGLEQERPPGGGSGGLGRGSSPGREIVDLSSPVSGSPARPGAGAGAGAGTGPSRSGCVSLDDSDDEAGEGVSLWQRLQPLYEARNPPKKPAADPPPRGSPPSPQAERPSSGTSSAHTAAGPKKSAGKAPSSGKGRKRARADEDACATSPESSHRSSSTQARGGGEQTQAWAAGADEMPDFAGMSIDQLRARLREQMHKIGTKPYMIAKLTELWEGTHRQQAEDFAVQQAKPPNDKKQKRANTQLDKDRATMVEAIELMRRLPIYDLILLKLNVQIGDVIAELRQEGLKVSLRLMKDILGQESIPYSQEGKRWKRRKRG